MEQLWRPRTGQTRWNQGPFLADLMADLVALLGAMLV